MSRIRFYADEDAAEHAVMEGLRQRDGGRADGSGSGPRGGNR